MKLGNGDPQSDSNTTNRETEGEPESQEAIKIQLYSSDIDGIPPIMFFLDFSSLLSFSQSYHSVHALDRSAQVLLIPCFNSVVCLAGGPLPLL